jgi:aconitate hydratase
LDLGEVVPSLAGPKRPQDRVALSEAQAAFRIALEDYAPQEGDDAEAALGDTIEFDALSFPASDPPAYTAGRGVRPPEHATDADHAEAIAAAREAGHVDHSVPILIDGTETRVDNGHVVIAAITSCTNTSNPSVMLAAGLVARNAVARGLESKPWVKTSLAPGSKVVTKYLDHAGLTGDLEALGFHLVGYGCTTCIGNSGPLPRAVLEAVAENDLAVVSVLSGNRNFEGRINPDVKMNYLASPPLVVAYALAGSMDADIVNDPIGVDRDGVDVYLRDLWPSGQEVGEMVEHAVRSEMFRSSYDDVFAGDERWNSLEVPTGDRFAWDDSSTYVHLPPYFEGMPAEPAPVSDIEGARVLAVLGDSVTTDHISPAGSIRPDGPAGQYLVEHGVQRKDFNSYGSRRGNHEVMVRGTFANVRLKNLLVPGSEGTWTVHLPDGEEMTIFEASQRYLAEGTPTIVIAGKEYGSGSSRDWAAKGPNLLGVRAAIAESYERIHRSNLLMMGIVPLQFRAGETPETLGITGHERFAIEGIDNGEASEVTVRADDVTFTARVRLDTPREREYLRHGGILPFVLRRLLAA